MNAATLDVAGLATRYYTHGAGEPVVFVHGGWFGSHAVAYGARIWTRTMNALGGRFETIAYDRPGQGETAAPLTGDDYTLDHDAKHAAAFLDALGKAPYHLVGHGHGGYVACRVAIDRPDLVRSCTIVDSGALAPGVSRQYLFADAPLPLLARESQRWMLETCALHGPAVVDAWLDEALALADVPSYRAAIAKMDGGLRDRLFAPALGRGRIQIFRHLVAHGLAMPTFVIWGMNDPIAPLETARLLLEALARKQPRTELRVINDAGHFVFLERPAAFERALASFLSGVTPAAV